VQLSACQIRKSRRCSTSIESKRSAFEGSLDDTLKNSTIKTQRGEIKTNEFFDDLQDQGEANPRQVRLGLLGQQ
jgi:hypothetical protein